MGAPPRYLMACVFVCLGIRSSATVLVSLLLVAACGAGVPAFHIEPTGEAHIPVVIIFYWVGRCAGWLKGRRRDAKCCRWNVERGGRGCWGKVLWLLSPAVAVPSHFDSGFFARPAGIVGMASLELGQLVVVLGEG